jgi:hypothetical protein
MNELAPSKERDAFEAFGKDQHWFMLRNPYNDDLYCSESVQMAWYAWRARASKEPTDRLTAAFWRDDAFENAALICERYEAHDAARNIRDLKGSSVEPPADQFKKRRPTLEESDKMDVYEERDWWRNYALEIERPAQPPPAGYVLPAAAVQMIVDAADSAGVERISFGYLEPNPPPLRIPLFTGIVSESVENLRAALTKPDAQKFGCPHSHTRYPCPACSGSGEPDGR